MSEITRAFTSDVIIFNLRFFHERSFFFFQCNNGTNDYCDADVEISRDFNKQYPPGGSSRYCSRKERGFWRLAACSRRSSTPLVYVAY